MGLKRHRRGFRAELGAQSARLPGAAGADVITRAALVWALGVPEARTALEVLVKGWHRGWANGEGLGRSPSALLSLIRTISGNWRTARLFSVGRIFSGGG